MSQYKKFSFIATNGWENEDDVQQGNSNSYSLLARSLERNIKNYVEKNKASSQKSIEKIKAHSFSRRSDLIKKRFQKIPSEEAELPIIAKGNKEILVFKTIDVDRKIKHQDEKESKQPKFYSINFLTMPRNVQNQLNEQRLLETIEKQSNKKYQRIREHRANKTSRRLGLLFKTKEQLQTLNEQTLQNYLLQRTKKNSQETTNVLNLPVVSR